MLEQLPDALGKALRDVRAGLDHIAFNSIGLRGGMGAITVTSLAFADHATMPPRFTADGEGASPPLSWHGVPGNATSLVLLVEDADAPMPHPLVHAIAVNLAAADGSLAEGALSAAADDDAAPQTGLNSLLRSGWLPPDPPPGHGVHRYAFQLFALAGDAAFSATPGRDEVLTALHDHAIASGSLIGTYERKDGSVSERAESAPSTAPLAGAA